MPRLNHMGPDHQGPKTGRNLGLCRKTKADQTGEYGKGQSKRRHAGGGTGKGKRLKYNEIQTERQ